MSCKCRAVYHRSTYADARGAHRLRGRRISHYLPSILANDKITIAPKDPAAAKQVIIEYPAAASG